MKQAVQMFRLLQIQMKAEEDRDIAKKAENTDAKVHCLPGID